MPLKVCAKSFSLFWLLFGINCSSSSKCKQFFNFVPLLGKNGTNMMVALNVNSPMFLHFWEGNWKSSGSSDMHISCTSCNTRFSNTLHISCFPTLFLERCVILMNLVPLWSQCPRHWHPHQIRPDLRKVSTKVHPFLAVSSACFGLFVSLILCMINCGMNIFEPSMFTVIEMLFPVASQSYTSKQPFADSCVHHFIHSFIH